MTQKKIAAVTSARINAMGKAVTELALECSKSDQFSDTDKLVAEAFRYIERAMRGVNARDFEGACNDIGNAAMRLVLIGAGINALANGQEMTVN